MCQATTWGEKSYVMKFQLARNMQVLIHQRLSPTLLLGQSVSCILLTTSWIELSSRFPSSSHTRVRPLCVYTHTHTHTHTHSLTHCSVSYRHFPTATQDGINPDGHLLEHRCLNPETRIVYTNITVSSSRVRTTQEAITLVPNAFKCLSLLDVTHPPTSPLTHHITF